MSGQIGICIWPVLQARRSSAESADEAFSIDFSRQHVDTGMDAPAFNPFAASGQTAFPMSPEVSPVGHVLSLVHAWSLRAVSLWLLTQMTADVQTL